MSNAPLVDRRRPGATLRIVAVAALAASLAACSTVGPSTAPASPTPATPTARPTASPPTQAGVIVTVAAGGETYRILLTEADDIAIARDLLAGKASSNIPNGRVVRGAAGVNTGYSWHIDPNDVEWAEMTIELCDGKPSDVEKNAISGDRFCPWSAQVVAIDEYPG